VSAHQDQWVRTASPRTRGVGVRSISVLLNECPTPFLQQSSLEGLGRTLRPGSSPALFRLRPCSLGSLRKPEHWAHLGLAGDFCRTRLGMLFSIRWFLGLSGRRDQSSVRKRGSQPLPVPALSLSLEQTGPSPPSGGSAPLRYAAWRDPSLRRRSIDWAPSNLLSEAEAEPGRARLFERGPVPASAELDSSVMGLPLQAL
jgi:hypothetical protein